VPIETQENVWENGTGTHRLGWKTKKLYKSE
jgi:hypothetical protein